MEEGGDGDVVTPLAACEGSSDIIEGNLDVFLGRWGAAVLREHAGDCGGSHGVANLPKDECSPKITPQSTFSVFARL